MELPTQPDFQENQHSHPKLELYPWYEQRKKSGQTGWKSLDGDGHACNCLPGGNGKKCPKKKK